MRSYTQMVVQCTAVQRTAVQSAGCSMRSYTSMVVQRATVQSVGCSMRSYTSMVVQRAAVQRAAGLGALLHLEISSG